LASGSIFRERTFRISLRGLSGQFLQRKSQSTQSAKLIAALNKAQKEVTMEYLILAGVVSMMALYALIIVGCSKQPEWQ
jgi:hypothetical protein